MPYRRHSDLKYQFFTEYDSALSRLNRRQQQKPRERENKKLGSRKGSQHVAHDRGIPLFSPDSKSAPPPLGIYKPRYNAILKFVPITRSVASRNVISVKFSQTPRFKQAAHDRLSKTARMLPSRRPETGRPAPRGAPLVRSHVPTVNFGRLTGRPMTATAVVTSSRVNEIEGTGEFCTNQFPEMYSKYQRIQCVVNFNKQAPRKETFTQGLSLDYEPKFTAVLPHTQSCTSLQYKRVVKIKGINNSRKWPKLASVQYS